MFCGDGEGLGEGAGAGCEVGCWFFCVSAFEDGGEAVEGLDGADEDGAWVVAWAGDDVEEVVDAVAEVDVGVAAGEVHGFGAFCAAVAVGVGGFVVDAGVGFGFCDDAGGECAVDAGGEDFAEELAGEGGGVCGLVEGVGEDVVHLTFFVL